MERQNIGYASLVNRQSLYDHLFDSYRSIKGKYIINLGTIDNLYYELENVKGIDNTRVKGTYNEERRMNHFYKISELIENYEKENSILKEYLDLMETIANRIPDDSIRKYVKNNYLSIYADQLKQMR